MIRWCPQSRFAAVVGDLGFKSHSYLPPIRYFESYLEESGDCSLIGYEDDEPKFFIPLQQHEDSMVSTSRSFVGGVYGATSSPERILKSLQDYLASVNQRIRFRFPDASAGLSLIELEISRSTEKIHRDTTFILNLQDYTFSSRRIRNLQKADRSGITVRVMNPQEVPIFWDLLTEGLAGRELNFIPSSRVVELTTLFPDYFKILGAESIDRRKIGVTFMTKCGSHMRLPNYFSDRTSHGIMEKMIQSAIDICFNLDVQFLDLGVSSSPITGEIVDGIATFKMELGAKAVPLYEYIVG